MLAAVPEAPKTLISLRQMVQMCLTEHNMNKDGTYAIIQIP